MISERRFQKYVDGFREKARANKVLLDHARRQELTDGTLRRALREAIQIERRVGEEECALQQDPEWRAFMYDPAYGFLVDDLLSELLWRTLYKQRPAALHEAEAILRAVVEDFGIDTRFHERVRQFLRSDWPANIEAAYDWMEMHRSHRYGTRSELEEEYLLMLEQKGATSPRAVRDLEREMNDRFPPPPFGNGPPESLEQLKELMHARAKELDLATGDLKLLDDWVTISGPSIIAAWES